MPFEKKRAKTGGKQKGYKSERTRAWEQIGEYLTDTGAEKARAILDSAQGKEFWNYYIEVLEFFKPKQQRTMVNDETPIKAVIFKNAD